jgi:capsular exopolysaccharide synthesis family protein
MEKLQKALQKAREQRSSQNNWTKQGDLASAAATVPHTSSQTDDAQGCELLWEALKPFNPSQKAIERNRIVAASAGPLATSFDILRTKTQLLMQKNNWSRLGITSPSEACGKTTLACNLAFSFARQSEMRVVLMEFDLRQPSMSQVLAATPKHDITEMLSGDVPFADQVLRIGDNVAVAMATKTSQEATSILQRRQTHATLAKIEEIYAPDLVIFDLPPLLVGDDTRAFLKDIDCSILVARAEATTVAQIDTCEREIAEHSNFLGVVLNQYRYAEDVGDYGAYHG